MTDILMQPFKIAPPDYPDAPQANPCTELVHVMDVMNACTKITKNKLVSNKVNLPLQFFRFFRKIKKYEQTRVRFICCCHWHAHCLPGPFLGPGKR